MINFKNENNIIIEINKYKKITLFTSIIRLILAILFIIFIIMLLSLKDYLLYGIISISLFIIFILFMLLTNKHYYHLDHLKIKKEIYEKHKKRRNYDLNTFFDNGQEFLKKDDYKQSDLDLFGSNSLYQYLNSCKTKRGRIKLASLLTEGKDYDISYAKAIKELTEDENTLNIEASINQISNYSSKLDYEEILGVLNNKIKINFLYLLPLLSFISTIVYLLLIFIINLNPLGLIGFVIFNFILTTLCVRNDVFKIKASAYKNLIESYINVSNTFINNKYESKLLIDYQNEINKLLPNLKSMNNILNILSSRSNVIFLIIFNSLFIFDFFITLLFNLKIKNYENNKNIFELLSDLEAMVSLSNIGIDNEIYSIPEEADSMIEAIDLYHPLIKNCVTNTININEGIILTGSNMSGKTTFLRTLGIIMTLYNASSIVPAKSFKAPKLNIYTSLRANDMLSEGVSTFYAEILRMKKINEGIKKGPSLVLIDEIFKGTNLNERLEASFKIIENLNKYNAYFIISTHDLELTTAKNILNYHFNEYYENDKIYFDYKIKEGKSETSNAMYLLKMADII